MSDFGLGPSRGGKPAKCTPSKAPAKAAAKAKPKKAMAKGKDKPGTPLGDKSFMAPIPTVQAQTGGKGPVPPKSKAPTGKPGMAAPAKGKGPTPPMKNGTPPPMKKKPSNRAGAAYSGGE